MAIKVLQFWSQGVNFCDGLLRLLGAVWSSKWRSRSFFVSRNWTAMNAKIISDDAWNRSDAICSKARNIQSVSWLHLFASFLLSRCRYRIRTSDCQTMGRNTITTVPSAWRWIFRSWQIRKINCSYCLKKATWRGVTSCCCGWKSEWWRPACCWLKWGSMVIGDPSFI